MSNKHSHSHQHKHKHKHKQPQTATWKHHIKKPKSPSTLTWSPTQTQLPPQVHQWLPKSLNLPSPKPYKTLRKLPLPLLSLRFNKPGPELPFLTQTITTATQKITQPVPKPPQAANWHPSKKLGCCWMRSCPSAKTHPSIYPEKSQVVASF